MRKLIFILFIGIFLLSFNNIVLSKDAQNFDYVIITTDELVDSLSNFTEWKQSLGYNVKIVTISWIESNYNGKDIQEKIRNFLIDKYEEWGIDYVLIAGSRDKIPMRKCYLNPSNHEDKYSIIETDYYYADLTGNWDADRDGYFGEIMQDKPDFYPEIYVGRIPSDDANKIRSICQHIINFEKSNKTWKKDVLLLGAMLYYDKYKDNWGEWHQIDGATLMEKCWNDIFKPNGFNATRMYEKEGIRPSIYACDYKLNYSNVFAEWKKHGIINIFGHGNDLIVARLIWQYDDGDNIPEDNELSFRTILRDRESKELTMMTPPIVFSGGCLQLRNSHNIGRAFIEDGAAVAFIGATTFSWTNLSFMWRDERDGGSLSLDYYFFHYLVNEGQKIGNALYNAKVYYYNHFGFRKKLPDLDLKIWAFYSNLFSFNLYGDPSMGLSNKKVDANPPQITIQQPENGIYIFGNKIFPFLFPLLIGKTDIKAIAWDENGIERVEFYMDNSLRASIENEPYEWKYHAIGFHKIKVVAIDGNGNRGGKEIEVFSL